MRCNICPRECNIDRKVNVGFCKSTDKIRVARAAPHYWEEPCISGEKGSGTVFFFGCNLKCVFCQNGIISNENYGKDVTDKELMLIFDKLLEQGVNNLNLVTPSHYADRLADILKEYQCPVPVVYNTSSYEKVDTIKKLEGLVDIYLPDIKYFDNGPALKYSNAQNYFDITSKAVLEMYRQVGDISLNENGIAEKGIIIRHMLLPGNISQCQKIFEWVSENLSLNTYISLMSQYAPYGKALEMSPINRPISKREYSIAKQKLETLGFNNVYYQKKSSSDTSFIPDFNLLGVDIF